MKIIPLTLALLVTAALPAAAEVDAWRVLGPGGGGGQFNPTINPRDQDNVLVSCDMTGAFVSQDAGLSWKMTNFGTVVRNYSFDPFRPGVAYAASVGLFRTEDNGRSWQRIFPAGETITTAYSGDHADPVLTIDGQPVPPVTAIRPVSATSLWLGHQDGAISRSQDSGKTWNSFATSLGAPVIALFPGSWWGKNGVIAVTATEAALVDAQGELTEQYPLLNDGALAVRGGFANGKALLYAITGDDVFLSRDAGKTWASIASGPIYEGVRFRSITVSEGSPEVAYLTCTSTPYGIFKTENAGESWHWVYKVAPSDEPGQDMAIKVGDYSGAWLDKVYGPDWREYPLDIGVSPTNPDICYVTDFGSTYRTIDGGKNWRQVYSIDHGDGSFSSRGLDVTTCYGVHFDPFDEDHLFVSYTDVGAFYSEDSGKSWRRGVAGIPTAWSNTCYWATFDPAVQGRAWSVWGSKHDLPRDKMFRRGDFFRRASGGVAASTDGGRTWTPLNSNGIPPDAVCTHIVLDPDSPEDSRTLYVTAFKKGIYKSTDGGESWVKLPDPSKRNQNYYRLALHPDGTLYALIARDRLTREDGSYKDTDGGLFRSADKGNTWEQVNLPESANFPTELKWDPADPRRLYLSLWPHAGAHGGEIFDTSGGVLASDDAGQSWTRIFDQTAFISGMTVHPADPARLFVVTFQGAAYTSDDRGANWRRIEGYDFKWGHHPFIDPRNPDQLYITTFGGSVWKGPFSTPNHEGQEGGAGDISFSEPSDIFYQASLSNLQEQSIADAP